MGKSYDHVRPEHWAIVMLIGREGSTVRAMATALNRSPSTISPQMRISLSAAGILLVQCALIGVGSLCR